MPYIKQEDRKILDNSIVNLSNIVSEYFCNDPTKIHSLRAGFLNYIITSIIKRVYSKTSFNLGLKYSDYNEIIGVLESCKQEFYRRSIAKYEDEKIKENGDV